MNDNNNYLYKLPQKKICMYLTHSFKNFAVGVSSKFYLELLRNNFFFKFLSYFCYFILSLTMVVQCSCNIQSESTGVRTYHLYTHFLIN